jgi:hypothetical protein
MELVSIGENCLVSFYLKEIGIQKEANIFDNCRSNIEYVTQIVKDLDSLVAKDNLYLKIVEGKRLVTKNRLYKNHHEIYCNYHTDDYEFTHHNLIDNPTDYDSFIRKVNRFKKILEDDKDIIFIYNYKYNEKNDLNILGDLVTIFINQIITIKKRNIKVYIISQTINKPTYKNQMFHIESTFTITSKRPNIINVNCHCSEPWINDNWNGLTDKELLIKIFKIIVASSPCS